MIKVAKITDRESYKAKTPCPFCGNREIKKGTIAVTKTILNLIIVKQATVYMLARGVFLCAKCMNTRQKDDISGNPNIAIKDTNEGLMKSEDKKKQELLPFLSKFSRFRSVFIFFNRFN